MASISYDSFLKENPTTVNKSPVSYSAFQEEDATKKDNSVSYDAFIKEKNNPKVPITDKIISGIKDYAKESADTVIPFGNAILNPIDTMEKFGSKVQQSYIDAIKKTGKGLYDIFKAETSAEKIAGGATAILGAADVAFTPITSSFSAAQKIPGLKQVADLTDVPFQLAGRGGSWTTEKVIDAIPDQIISAQSKEIIKGPFKDLGALATQLLIGKMGEKFTPLIKRKKEIPMEEVRKIVEQSKIEVKNTPQEGSVLTQDKIEVKNTPPQEGVPAQAKIEVKNTPQEGSVLNQDKSVIAAEKNAVTNIESMPTKKIEISTETKPTKLSSTLESDVIAKGIEADFGKSPEYNVMNMKDQAEKALNIINNSPEYAKNILDGKVAPPGDLKIGSVYTAMKLDAIKRNDVAKIIELSKSEVNKIASSYGQEIKAFDSLLEHDPVKLIDSVRKSRETPKKARELNTEINNVKKELELKKPKVEDWDSFIRSIQC